MKKFLGGPLLVLLILTIPVIARSQEKKDPQFKLIEFHMALLKRGPKWIGDKTGETESLESAQREYAWQLACIPGSCRKGFCRRHDYV